MHQFRGISKASGQWVHGGFWYDGNEYYIIPRLHQLVPIIPETLGKQILYGSMSFYSGDIVMWSRFKEEPRNAARLEDLIDSDVGIIMHSTVVRDNGEEETVIIAEEQYTCGVELEELHPSGVKIIGNIFDTGFYWTANSDCYSGLKPYWFTDTETGSGETVTGGYFYDRESQKQYIVKEDQSFMEVEWVLIHDDS